MRTEQIKVGQIVNAHGIRGDLKLNPHRVEARLLLQARIFYIDGQALQPQSLRVHKGTLLFRLPGVEDMNAALAYKGKDVYLRPDEITLPEGEVFDEQLLGLRVLDEESGEELGRITDVLLYPAHKVYQVQGAKSYLIPAVPGVFIRQIDLRAETVTVHMLEGLESNAN